MKDKHITVNLKEEQYNQLEQLANEQDRTITNICYLLITNALSERNKDNGII